MRGEHVGEAIQRGDHQDQESIPGKQSQVLEHAADHGPQQVAGEGHVRSTHIPERVGEDKVREEDRGKGDSCGQRVSKSGRVDEQLLGGEQIGQRQRQCESHVERQRPSRPEPAGDPDRHQHAGQNREEDEGVHDPGGPEEQREADQALRLEQQEGCPECEEVRAEAAHDWARAPADQPDPNNRDEDQEGERAQVVRGDEGLP